MKKMSLLDIQEVSLGILKHFDIFCRKNSINYSLGYGTLIGAIRHKGFIPWDDDIDVVMPRPDYERFIQLYVDTPNYKIFAPEKGNNYYTISRICEMQKTFVKKYYSWAEEDTGVWIDIFPIDDSRDFDSIRKVVTKCYAACRIERLLSPQLKIRTCYYNLKYLFKYGCLNRSKMIKLYNNKIKYCDYFSASFVSNFGSPYKDKDIHKKDVFSEYIKVPFCDTEVSILKKYDDYLKTIYGDYMKFPPEERRVRKHTENKYYWRKGNDT